MKPYLFRPTTVTAKHLHIAGISDAINPIQGSWFITFDRFSQRGYLLFTHSETLFSVLLRAPKTAEHLAELFTEQLFRVLKFDGMFDAFEFFADPRIAPPLFAKTNSRSVLASMTQQRSSLKAYDNANPFECSDLVDAARWLNNTPMSALGEPGDYGYPIKLLRPWIASQAN